MSSTVTAPLPHPAFDLSTTISSSSSTRQKAPSIVSSLYSIEDSLRDVVGAITIYNRENREPHSQASSATHITEIPPQVDDHTKSTTPPPSNPPPAELTEDFNSCIRDFKENATHCTGVWDPLAAPQARGESTHSLLSAFLAACSLKDDRRPRGKGKEREPEATSRGFTTPWRRQKGFSKHQKPPTQSSHSEDLLGTEGTAAGEPVQLPHMVQITFSTGVGEKTCWTSMNSVDSWMKLLGFIRYASFPETMHSETRPGNITVEDCSQSLDVSVTEDTWISKVHLAAHRTSTHLHVSFDQQQQQQQQQQLPSKSSRFLSALMHKKQRGSIVSSLGDKSTTTPTSSIFLPANGIGLQGNAIFNVVAYLPPGLQLRVVVKLVDPELAFSYANCLVIHEGSRSADASAEWSLETDSDWEFVFPEPDEVITRASSGDPGLSHEVQYGLKRAVWEPYGSLLVSVTRFSSTIEGIMKGLEYPDRKISEYIAHWWSRLEVSNPTHIEIRVLSHNSSSTLTVDPLDPETHSVHATRLHLSFRPLRTDIPPTTTGDLNALSAKIREHSFPPPAAATVRIFEAGGMLLHVCDDIRDSYWVCCNPDNYASHGRAAWSAAVGVCGECAHGRCAQCLVTGGVRRNSVGSLGSTGGGGGGGRVEVHAANPVERYAGAIKEGVVSSNGGV